NEHTHTKPSVTDRLVRNTADDSVPSGQGTTDSNSKSNTAFHGRSRAKTSCHQCKNNKNPEELLFCKNVKWGPGKKRGNYVLKHCRKKFCFQCISKYMPSDQVEALFVKQHTNVKIAEFCKNQFEEFNTRPQYNFVVDLGIITVHIRWKCPACVNTCECAACCRRRNPKVDAARRHRAQENTPQK
ncbi:hypothetical protein RFI_19434, partial [Reticulomyxa filosa]